MGSVKRLGRFQIYSRIENGEHHCIVYDTQTGHQVHCDGNEVDEVMEEMKREDK